jgi:hypothetical protein
MFVPRAGLAHCECRVDRDALGPQPKSVPVVGEHKWVALLRQPPTCTP